MGGAIPTGSGFWCLALRVTDTHTCIHPSIHTPAYLTYLCIITDETCVHKHQSTHPHHQHYQNHHPPPSQAVDPTNECTPPRTNAAQRLYMRENYRYLIYKTTVIEIGLVSRCVPFFLVCLPDLYMFPRHALRLSRLISQRSTTYPFLHYGF